MVALTLAAAALGTAQPASAPAIKAAFLANFMKFVEWPSDAMTSIGPISACVVGNPAVTEALEQIVKGRTINGHDVVVRNATVDGTLRSCHLLYLSDPDSKLAQQIVQLLIDHSVFTVSDFERFAALGGVTNFFVEDGRLRFVINLNAARRARLNISSKLLVLATVIESKP